MPAQDFIRQYYHGVAEEDLTEYPSEHLAAAALSHLRFATTRKPRRPCVRVYNPDEASDGFSSKHTIVEVTIEDMPFLVDSLGMVLTQAGLTIHLMVHPVLAVRRDRGGRLIELAELDDTSKRYTHESWQHIETDRIEDPVRLQDLERKLVRTLDDVQLAVEDWREMRQRARDAALEIARNPPPIPPGEANEIRGDAGVDGRQPLHVPRLSAVPVAPRPFGRHARAVARNRPRHPARATRDQPRAEGVER